MESIIRLAEQELDSLVSALEQLEDDKERSILNLVKVQNKIDSIASREEKLKNEIDSFYRKFPKTERRSSGDTDGVAVHTKYAPTPEKVKRSYDDDDDDDI